MTSVYVGKYKDISDSRHDQKRLNNLGIKGYVFNMGEYYSLRVYTYPSPEKAKQMMTILQMKKFENVYLK